MDIDIDRLSENELLRLNQRIVARLKFLESLHAHAEMLQFEVGQQVSFDPPGRDRQVGILVKYNKKTVTVLTDSGQRWNVSPHLLSPVKEVRRAQSGRGGVIDIKSKR